MKKAVIAIFIVSALQAAICNAQIIDTNRQTAERLFSEAKKAADRQQIWDTELYGPMMFVDVETRKTWANMPDDAGVLKPDGTIYTGLLPANVMLANTAIDWGGRKWSVMLWPLPADRDDRVNLMMHESFHRVQRKLGLPDQSPTVDHLDKKEGRIYFFLELQALKKALTDGKPQRKDDLKSALVFRAKRQLLYPETFKNEQFLEMNEGIAEYTGVMLGRNKDSIVHHLQAVIDGATNKTSLIRSMAYITGPVYGYLLYDANATWTRTVKTTDSFPALIERYYHISLKNEDVNALADKRAAKYGSEQIIASETRKYEAHKQQEQQYINLFTLKPVLTIPLEKVQVSFNPSNLFDLGEYGTLYPTMSVTDTWGTLEVTEGGALMKDWKIIYLPLTGKDAPNAPVMEGNGWKLTLANGYKVIPGTAKGSQAVFTISRAK